MSPQFQVRTPALVCALIVSAGLGFVQSAAAQAVPPAPPSMAGQAKPPITPMIHVTGEGRAAIAPDMAIVSLSVTRLADTAEAALAASNDAMRAVLKALQEEGIAERDIQTSDFSIYPRYSQPNSSRPQPEDETPRITGYQVSNGLTVRVRDLSKLGPLLDRSVKLGINQGGQISFTNSDPKGVLEEARKGAVADAMAKAKTLAEAAGRTLGPVLSISENSRRPEPMPLMRTMAMAKEADSVPIAGGENSYAVEVEMSFSLTP